MSPRSSIGARYHGTTNGAKGVEQLEVVEPPRARAIVPPTQPIADPANTIRSTSRVVPENVTCRSMIAPGIRTIAQTIATTMLIRAQL